MQVEPEHIQKEHIPGLAQLMKPGVLNLQRDPDHVVPSMPGLDQPMSSEETFKEPKSADSSATGLPLGKDGKKKTKNNQMWDIFNYYYTVPRF